ncbi:hypothetical protein [Demequina sediminicola]|uniref:hypothetical protein n=1 Tax=Demequina sediminicola TaxID=1095026 RepID=UPI000782484C|nr:hypothetical protein [Demequina sediminicola]
MNDNPDVHVVVEHECSTMNWRPSIRTVVGFFQPGMAMVQSPYSTGLLWPHVKDGLDVAIGDTVFGLWRDRLFAGMFPGTSLMCTDLECTAKVVREYANGRQWDDKYVMNGHIAIHRGFVLPGTAGWTSGKKTEPEGEA